MPIARWKGFGGTTNFNGNCFETYTWAAVALSGSAGSFEHAREFQERFVASWGGYPRVGTPEQVVEGLGQLNEAGMDCMIMGLLDFNEEMKYFGEKVMPLMVQAGLRQ